MPTGLRIWLSEKKPATCSEAGKLADDYLLARQRGRKDSSGRASAPESRGHVPGPPTQISTSNQPWRCYSCGQQGHWARNCPATTSTEHAKTTPLISMHTPLSTESNNKPPSERKCHKRGHLANQCPSRAFYCGTLGAVVGCGTLGVGSGEGGCGTVGVVGWLRLGRGGAGWW